MDAAAGVAAAAAEVGMETEGEAEREEEAEVARERAREGLIGGTGPPPTSGVSPARGVEGDERFRDLAAEAAADDPIVPF